jgi:hypothetical protein
MLLLTISTGRCGDKSCDKSPVVEISNVRTQHGSLTLNWVIRNTTDNPIFVYSTFLRGRAAAWAAGSGGADYQIYTSQPQKLNAQVNSYPAAKFVRVGPGDRLMGIFRDSKPTVQISRGKKLLFVVAYGPNTDDVEEAIRRSFHEKNGFAGNPIVDWQCLALSNIEAVR